MNDMVVHGAPSRSAQDHTLLEDVGFHNRRSFDFVKVAGTGEKQKQVLHFAYPMESRPRAPKRYVQDDTRGESGRSLCSG
jgi:hypothetical protein